LNILIVGAGKLGSKLADHFNSNGHNVWGWRRNPPASSSNNITFESVDISQEITVLPKSLFDLVFYMVAPVTYEEKSYKESYPLGVKNTIDWLKKNNLNPKFVFISSTGVYGQTNGESVDEKSIVSSDSISGKYLLDAEDEVANSGLVSCCVRFGGIYDESRLGAFSGCYFKTFPKEQENCYLNLIHSEDCVGVLSLLSKVDVLDRCYLGVDDLPSTRGDIYKWFVNKNVELPIKKRALGLGRKKNISYVNKKCLNNKIKSLGYTFKYPSFKVGLKIFQK
jgi:nucleoside-diphosphate-sugar epimerase